MSISCDHKKELSDFLDRARLRKPEFLFSRDQVTNRISGLAMKLELIGKPVEITVDDGIAFKNDDEVIQHLTNIAYRHATEIFSDFMSLRGNRLRIRLKEKFGYNQDDSSLTKILRGYGKSEKTDPSTKASDEVDLGDTKPSLVNNLLSLAPSDYSIPLSDLSKLVVEIGLGREILNNRKYKPDPPVIAKLVLLVKYFSIRQGGRFSDQQTLALTRIFELGFFQWHQEIQGLTGTIFRLLSDLNRQKVLPFLSKQRLLIWTTARTKEETKLKDSIFKVNLAQSSGELENICHQCTAESLPVDVLAEFEEINKEICDLFTTKAQLYGSAVNGFSVPGSDVDAAVILPGDKADELRLAVEEALKKIQEGKSTNDEEEVLAVPEKAVEVAAIRLVASRIEQKFPGLYKIEKIESARVPILIVKRFPPESTVSPAFELNLSFNHPLPILNSKLLFCYSQLHPKIRNLVQSVKLWAKRRGLADALAGGFSSYSWTLLVISYLISLDFIPSLQPDYPEFVDFEQKPVEELKFDNFIESGKTGKDVLGSEKWSVLESSVSIAQLLLGFFEYYGNGYLDFYANCASVRGKRGIAKKPGYYEQEANSSGKHPQSRLWLSIVDPFEANRTIGVSARSIDMIIEELRRGSVILRGEAKEQLFAACVVGEKKRRGQTTGSAIAIGPCKYGGLNSQLTKEAVRKIYKKEIGDKLINEQSLEMVMQCLECLEIKDDKDRVGKPEPARPISRQSDRPVSVRIPADPVPETKNSKKRSSESKRVLIRDGKTKEPRVYEKRPSSSQTLPLATARPRGKVKASVDYSIELFDPAIVGVVRKSD
jgi:DNA polymerase sigma